MTLRERIYWFWRNWRLRHGVCILCWRKVHEINTAHPYCPQHYEGYCEYHADDYHEEEG